MLPAWDPWYRLPRAIPHEHCVVSGAPVSQVVQGPVGAPPPEQPWPGTAPDMLTRDSHSICSEVFAINFEDYVKTRYLESPEPFEKYCIRL